MNSISLAIFKTKFHMKINKTIGNFRNTNKYRIVTFLKLKTHNSFIKANFEFNLVVNFDNKISRVIFTYKRP